MKPPHHPRRWSVRLASSYTMALALLFSVPGPPTTAAELEPSGAAAAPGWVHRHMTELVGRWIADNAEYRSEQEPFDAYGMEWSWAIGGKSVTGRLFGLTEGEESDSFWEYRVAWHPGERALTLQQYGPDGSYATGRIEDEGDGASEALQTLFRPDGGSTKIGHREKVDGEGRHSRSFVVAEDESWQPMRSYLWRRDAVEEARRSDGLDFLEPFVGVWLPHPDWEPLKHDPKLETLVPLNLKWADQRSFLEISEGLLGSGDYSTSGLLVWNPLTETAEFLAKQVDGDLIFDGYYEPLSATSVRRVYDVIRPDGTVDVYRERFDLTDSGVLDWTTEKKEGAVFKQVRGSGSGPEFHAVRPAAEPVDALADLAALVGEWRPDPERMPADFSRWREENGVEDGYVSLAWGSGRRWIEFGEHRKQNGEWRLEGSGLIAWDPARRQLVYREHSDGGVTLEGSLERVDPRTVRRYYRTSHPDGSVRRWEDTWRFNEGQDDCFEWTTARIQG